MPDDVPKTHTTLRTVFNACTAEHWNIARVWLAYTLFYGLLPSLLGLAGAFVLPSSQIRWIDFLIHGEFLMYAATLTATSTRLITKDLRKGGDPFVHRQMFNLFSHVVIIPSAAIYAVLKYQSLRGSSEMNLHYVTWVSILMLLSAIVFSFFVFLFDAQRSSPATAEAFNRELRQEEANLNRQFDALEKKDADGE